MNEHAAFIEVWEHRIGLFSPDGEVVSDVVFCYQHDAVASDYYKTVLALLLAGF